MSYSWRYRGASLLGVPVILIIYCVGLFYDSWIVVYKESKSRKVIANMGLFKACGFNHSLQIPSYHYTSRFPPLGKHKECFNLIGYTNHGWVPIVQGFSLFCLVLLIFLGVTFCIIWYTSRLSERPFMVFLIISCFITGAALLVHVLVFISNVRPSEVTYPGLKSYDGKTQPKIVIKTFYWGAFYLHCIAAGGFNLINLMLVCALLLGKS